MGLLLKLLGVFGLGEAIAKAREAKHNLEREKVALEREKLAAERCKAPKP